MWVSVSTWVNICVTEYGQLITTCVCVLLVRINANHTRVLFSLQQHITMGCHKMTGFQVFSLNSKINFQVFEIF